MPALVRGEGMHDRICTKSPVQYLLSILRFGHKFCLKFAQGFLFTNMGGKSYEEGMGATQASRPEGVSAGRYEQNMGHGGPIH